MAAGRPLGSKLFLEGVEVPFIGASFTHTVGQASIAYIDLIPQKEINNVSPRTHVMLAVRDYNNKKDGFPYVLAWEGEVFGYSFGKTTGSRSFTLQCIDLSSYWDNCLSYFLNPIFSLGKGGDVVGLGLGFDSAEKQGTPVISSIDGTTSFLYEQINKESAGGDFLKGFAAVYKAISGVNEFFQIAERRLRIADRILIQSSGNLSALLKKDVASNWFNGIMGKTAGGGYATLRTVIQDMMSVIFHDFCAVPFPAGVVKEDLKLPSAAPDSADNKKSKNTTVGQFILKPNLFMVPPPICNVFFPDEYSNFQYSRNFFQEITRLLYKPEIPLFLGNSSALPLQFEPPSLQHFMMEEGLKIKDEKGNDVSSEAQISKYVGTDDQQVNKKWIGFFGNKVENPFTAVSNGVIREGQFLTNEERMKGIWMAQESMVPATTRFTSDVPDEDRQNLGAKVAKYLFFKKRTETRQLQITSHLKLSVVPGFNILLLDASDSEQSTLAYCSSVTHRIYATEGGYTNVQLSYARTVKEEKVSSENGNEPPIPPWFDANIFGSIVKPPVSKAAGTQLSSKGKVLVTPTNGALSDYYAGLLGSKGSKSLTDINKNEPTVIGAAAKLLADYNERSSHGTESLQDYISDISNRDYIRIESAFAFISAKLKGAGTSAASDVRGQDFNVFLGGAFDTADATYGDIMEKKLKVINAYRDALQKYRGFRG